MVEHEAIWSMLHSTLAILRNYERKYPVWYLGPAHSPVHLVQEDWPRGQSGRSVIFPTQPPSSTEVKNTWSCTSTHP
jgi:hypothetical protein